MSTTPTATLPYPLFDFADALGHLPVGDQAKIMGGNLARLVTA
jgi:hypothetical protein